jgi:hypothetical protein
MGRSNISLLADQNIFPTDTSLLSSGSTLCVTALIGPAASAEYKVRSNMAREELIPAPLDVLYIIAHSLLGRYPNGISGIHPFLALLQVVTSKKLTDPELHDREFGMLRIIGRKTQSDPNPFMQKSSKIFREHQRV